MVGTSAVFAINGDECQLNRRFESNGILETNHLTKWDANDAKQAKLHGVSVKQENGLGAV